MKKIINKILANVFNVQVRRIVSFKEHPIPLVKLHGLKLIYFYDLMKKIENIEGDIVECGVGYGRSLYALCLCGNILKRNSYYYGFDSFEGFPEPTREDSPERFDIKKGRYKTNQKSVIRFLMNSGIEMEFIDRKLKLIKGFFSDSLHRYDSNKVALLHLDVDLYSSYKECLEFFYPKIVKDGIITFDEYQAVEKFPGAKRAIDEFFHDKPEKLIKSDIIERYYVIKK